MTTQTKAINSLKTILKDDFSAKSFTKEVCWTLSRSLDERNQYGIPATIRKTVAELRDLTDPSDPDYDVRASSSLAERKMDFIRNLEDKLTVYKAALDEWKILYCELTGNEFHYQSAKSSDEKRRDAGATKQAMDALLAKYG